MIRAVITAVVIILVIVLLSQSFYTVDETKQAIILKFGEYQKTTSKSGIHAKIPFMETAKTLDKRVLLSDAPPTDYITLDKTRISIDHVTRWKIIDPRVFYESFGADQENAETRLKAIVVKHLRDELAAVDFIDIVSTQRERIVTDVTQRTAEEARQFGIEVIDVNIKRADLPVETESKVFARMISERERIAKESRAKGEEEALKIRAEADREATVLLAQAYKTEQTLMGEGDALATAIYAAAYAQGSEFYSLLRTLEAYSNFMNDGTTLVLSSESDLMKYLSSSEPSE